MKRPHVLSIVLMGAVLALLSASSAHADFNLQIIEIWMGNDPGSNLSQDWFEVTNFGDMPWTGASDGFLFFDDESASSSNAVFMDGIASISPGESVIYVDGSFPDVPAGAAEWSALWTPEVSPLPQVGYYDGPGLGQGGDAVTLFIDTNGPESGIILGQLDFEAYPDANANGGQSWDVPLGAFSTVGNASGAVATLDMNDQGQVAIGSPGTSVPEPASILLLACGAAPILLARRRRPTSNCASGNTSN